MASDKKPKHGRRKTIKTGVQATRFARLFSSFFPAA